MKYWKHILGLFVGAHVGLVLLVGIIALIVSVFSLYRDHLHVERVLKPVAQDLVEMQAEAKQKLESYGVVDKDKGVYRIPVQRAMELELKEKGRRN